MPGYHGAHGGMKRNKHGATEAEKPARMRNRSSKGTAMKKTKTGPHQIKSMKKTKSQRMYKT